MNWELMNVYHQAIIKLAEARMKKTTSTNFTYQVIDYDDDSTVKVRCNNSDIFSDGEIFIYINHSTIQNSIDSM